MKKAVVLKSVLALLMCLIVVLFYVYDLGQYTSLDAIKRLKQEWEIYYQKQTLLVLFGFFFLYVFVTTCSLPLASPMTLLAGALFGLPLGLLLVSFASSIGATLAFLIARFLAKDFIQQRYGTQLQKINDGFEQEGAFYLFAARLVPIFPFFVINLAMALVNVRAWTFYWVSQIGMLPGTAVFVYAGTQLIAIDTLSDVASPGLLLAFALLGVFPLLAKKLLAFIRNQEKKTDV